MFPLKTSQSYTFVTLAINLSSVDGVTGHECPGLYLTGFRYVIADVCVYSSGVVPMRKCYGEHLCFLSTLFAYGNRHFVLCNMKQS